MSVAALSANAPLPLTRALAAAMSDTLPVPIAQALDADRTPGSSCRFWRQGERRYLV